MSREKNLMDLKVNWHVSSIPYMPGVVGTMTVRAQVRAFS